MATSRTVLVAVRSPAALHRLLDIVPVFEGDTRIQLVFAVDRGSRFSGDLVARLVAAGAHQVEWAHAVAESFDLALAASDNGDLHRVAAPLILVPHGAGYQRFAAHEPGAVSGLRRSTLVHDGRVVPRRIVVSHPDQLDIVRAVEPRLLSRAIVAGDPCFDRIRLSTALRDRYRAAFDAAGRRLVVLCSTWGEHSLFGRQPDLPTRVVAELETDRYRTALVLHPNVWARHGHLQVRTWLGPAIAAGLVLVPPEEGWRAALVAADLVISDHGSLTSYAVGAGSPVLLAEDGEKEVVPGSPMDRLRHLLPRLRPDTPIAEQLHTATASAPDIAGTLFAHRGEALQRLRVAIYEQLRLAPPRMPTRVVPLPVPELETPVPTACAVQSEVDAQPDGIRVVLHRFPAVTHDDDQPHPRHLAVDDAEVDPGWAERAAVVWHDRPFPSTARARDWATTTLRRLPAVRVVVSRVGQDSLLAMTRDGRELLAEGTTDAALVGSAIQSCLERGMTADRLQRLDITTGEVPTRVRLHPR